MPLLRDHSYLQRNRDKVEIRRLQHGKGLSLHQIRRGDGLFDYTKNLAKSAYNKLPHPFIINQLLSNMAKSTLGSAGEKLGSVAGQKLGRLAGETIGDKMKSVVLPSCRNCCKYDFKKCK